MIFTPNDTVRLTPSELNTLRQVSAKNGRVVNGIRTRQELLIATLDGLSPELQFDLLEFLETGASIRARKDRVPAA
jgi:hypothetical protein